jgi:hypothetical protein
MPHLRRHLLDRIGDLALGELLVGKIEDHENDGSGSQCFHERSPNQVGRVKRQRVFELGHLQPSSQERRALGQYRGEAAAFGQSRTRYFSPSNLPVDVLMKCIPVQAGHLTGA